MFVHGEERAQTKQKPAQGKAGIRRGLASDGVLVQFQQTSVMLMEAAPS